MKKVLAAVLAGAMLTASMAGCSGTASSSSSSKAASDSKADSTAATSTASAEDEALTCTLNVWGPAEDQAKDKGNWLPTTCEQFKKLHPKWNITFKYSACSEGDAGKTVTQDPSAAGDVYFFANDQINTLISANALSELGGSTVDEIKSSCSKEIIDSVTVKDSVYGVPFTTNTWFMYYNKSKFSDTDVKSLDAMLKKGKVAFPISNSWYLPAFFIANSCTMYGDKGTDESAGIQFGGDKGTEVTKYLATLVANPNFKNDADGSGLAGLRDGSISAYFSGSWDAAAVKEALGSNFGAVSLPTVNIGGSEKQLKSFSGSKAIGVNPNTKNPQVAVALAKYLGGADAQRSHYKLRSIVPCNTEVLKDTDIQKDAMVTAQNETFEKTSIIQPFVASMKDFWTPTENFGKALISKEITKDNAASKVEALTKAYKNPVS